MAGENRIGVVIPTKNRAEDISEALKSIKDQTRLPYEVIIVDQSESKPEDLAKILRGAGEVKLKYIFDPGLSGLTAAKNAGVRAAESDVLLFIDDDVVLDERFLEVLEGIYDRYPELGGVGGLAEVSYTKVSALRRRVALFFQVGPFRDYRAVIQAGYMRDRDIIRTSWLSGGLSSVRRAVFDKVSFNEDFKGASPIEDFDFYFKASKYFRFALAPQAKALHNISSVSRATLRRSFERKCSGFCYIFSRYIEKTFANRCAFFLRNTGFLIDALVKGVLYKTLDPLKGMCSAWYKVVFRREFII